MEIRQYVLLIVLGGAAVTLMPRVLPLLLLSRVTLPRWLRIWLSQVPVAILAALLAQELAFQGGALVLPFTLARNLPALAILPVLLVAALTRSLIGAVAAGVAAMALLRTFT
jgi:branched-subunit amino acid transport protein